MGQSKEAALPGREVLLPAKLGGHGIGLPDSTSVEAGGQKAIECRQPHLEEGGKGQGVDRSWNRWIIRLPQKLTSPNRIIGKWEIPAQLAQELPTLFIPVQGKEESPPQKAALSQRRPCGKSLR